MEGNRKFSKKRKAVEMLSESGQQDCHIKMKNLELCTPLCALGRFNVRESMVPCGLCDRWYHFQCLGLSASTQQSNRGLYLCDHCRDTFRQRGPRLDALETLVANLKKRLDQVQNPIVAADLAASEIAARTARSAYSMLLSENEELKKRLLERKQARRERRRQRREHHDYFQSLAETQRRIRIKMCTNADATKKSKAIIKNDTESSVQSTEKKSNSGRRQKKIVTVKSIKENAQLSPTTKLKNNVIRGGGHPKTSLDAENTKDNTQLHVTTKHIGNVMRRGRPKKSVNAESAKDNKQLHVTTKHIGNVMRRGRPKRSVNAESAKDIKQLHVTTKHIGNVMRRGRPKKSVHTENDIGSSTKQRDVTTTHQKSVAQHSLSKKLSNLATNRKINALVIRKRKITDSQVKGALAISDDNAWQRKKSGSAIIAAEHPFKCKRCTQTFQLKKELRSHNFRCCHSCGTTFTKVSATDMAKHRLACGNATVDLPAKRSLPKGDEGIIAPEQARNSESTGSCFRSSSSCAEPEPVAKKMASDSVHSGLYDKAIVINPDLLPDSATTHDDIQWAPIHLMHVTMEPDTITID